LTAAVRAAGPQQMRRIEHLLDPQHRCRTAAGEPVHPAWRRPTAGEKRWPAAAATAVAVAVGLQVALPDRFNLASRYLLPDIEAAMLIALVTLNPHRVDRISKPVWMLALALIAVASLANAYSAASLILRLINGSEGVPPVRCCPPGPRFYLTNIIIFALWYWELDRGVRSLAGSPGARLSADARSDWGGSALARGSRGSPPQCPTPDAGPHSAPMCSRTGVAIHGISQGS